jgi:hypothetical protein
MKKMTWIGTNGSPGNSKITGPAAGGAVYRPRL